jgi:hypothetical protein
MYRARHNSQLQQTSGRSAIEILKSRQSAVGRGDLRGVRHAITASGSKQADTAQLKHEKADTLQLKVKI